MTVERDIAGFALPFAAAVTAAGYFGSPIGNSHIISTSVALILTAFPMLILMHPRHFKMNGISIRILIALLGLGTGVLCAMRAHASVISSIDMNGILHKAAHGFGLGMQEAIDSIPFKDERTGAILKALITGERSDIPRDVTEAFRNSGAAHILSLSGLHLGIIYGALRKTTGWTGNSPSAVIVRSAITVTVCGFYTLATGAGDSIVRALLFIAIGEAARLTGRYRSTGSVLFAALIIQLTISPESARSAGFQLSYAAMAGIAFIFPWLKSLWPEDDDAGRYGLPALRWIWNSVAMSIACQLTTGPIVYAYFGTFPQYFLLTNLIAVPLTGIILPVALITLILSVSGLCPSFLISVTEGLTCLLTWSLDVIASM